MSGISTKDVKAGGGLPKVIEPGQHVLKINEVRLARFPFMEADSGYFLILDVETKPIPDFEGFFIDKDDESQGRYKGQIGQIKTNRFYYKDGETKGGTKVFRDMDILRQIKNICVTIGSSWLEKADGKYETIEDLVAAFSKAAPYKNKYLKFCVAGKEFNRDNGYVGYDLYLPKLERQKVAFEQEDAKESKLLKFDESKHITKAENKEVKSFEGEELPEDPMGAPGEIPIDSTHPDLSNAPEFEL